MKVFTETQKFSTLKDFWIQASILSWGLGGADGEMPFTSKCLVIVWFYNLTLLFINLGNLNGYILLKIRCSL